MTAVGTAKTKFDTSIDKLLASVDTRLSTLEESFRSKLQSIGPLVASYLDDVEITTVLRGTTLTNQLNDAVNGANTIISTSREEANFLINQEVENIQYDYQSGLEIAVDQFNDDIGEIGDWTEAMTSELETVSSAISTKISDTHTAFSDKVEACMTDLAGVSNLESETVNVQIDKWVNNHPMVYLTGFVQLPQALYRGESNRFRIGVSNAGGADWYGWIGMRLVLEDEEGYVSGSWEYNNRPGKTPVLMAGTSSVYAVDIGVPSEVEDGEILTLYLLVNTP